MTLGQRIRLSIDGGQTGCRLRLRGPGGVIGETGAAGVLTDRDVVAQMAARASRLSEESGERIDELAIGLSGLTPGNSRPEELLALVRPLGVSRVAIAHDSISGYLAANGEQSGVMLAVGTGVVVLAVGDDPPAGATAVAKVDGWGSLLGDAGSGYWIGRAGLDAAMRSFDERAPESALERLAHERFGELDELYMVLQADERRVSVIASFCRQVVAAAVNGDRAAAAIVAGAAAELSHSASSALLRVGWTPGTPTRVGAVGALPTEVPLFRAELALALETTAPGAALATPIGEPLDGVERLPDVPPQHALAAYISTAAL